MMRKPKKEPRKIVLTDRQIAVVKAVQRCLAGDPSVLQAMFPEPPPRVPCRACGGNGRSGGMAYPGSPLCLTCGGAGSVASTPKDQLQ